ncbi:glycosyltransferase [Frigoriflavimonas asaccharolytica]|uniref:Glycosyltransferase involved in cell wall biosynthesis n=1 Tax=Frigoriflavimonas asaccharolytica TaxID=2735899 RepID=A0A8J8GAT6_9FLAO|nr:glycosyltransferase [Frigoriflavimonas asaccharolytica]NRS92227.1 glycosyltransferase involved in cell wall biosynthesis [Frigoriflavimonas asaccharolytica]
MKRKNILFISSWFPNKTEPTAGNFVQRHAEAVSLLNDVEVLHTVGIKNQKEKFVFEDQIINDVRILIIYFKNSKFSTLNFLRRMKAYKFGFQKMTKPDLVHANVMHNPLLFVVWLKKMYNIPFIITEHWTALQKDNLHKTPNLILKIARIIGNQAEFILPVSQNLLESLELIGIKTKKKVISNVVNTEVFNIKKNEISVPKFLHISNLIPRKKADRIIAVAKKLHDDGFKFTVELGGDGDFQNLQKQIENLNAENFIETFGELSYQQVAEKMQNSSCFILFSENETQGCVILESFACGIPVISTAVGGVPEFLQKDFGILIKKNNETDLYEAMKNLLENTIKIEKPEVMRNYVLSNFSRESIAKQFDEIYTKVLQ